MHKRTLHGPLTVVNVRLLRRALREAKRLGKYPNMMFTIHPGHLEQCPCDAGRFFERGVVAWLGGWFRRQGHQWTAVWTRENYLSPHREHMHMLLHVPKRLQKPLARALARRWPDPGVAHLRPVDDAHEAFAYIVKQHTPQAHYALGFRVRRERHCRHDQTPVAPVLGRRVSMTRDLERLVRYQEIGAADVGGYHAR